MPYFFIYEFGRAGSAGNKASEWPSSISGVKVIVRNEGTWLNR